MNGEAPEASGEASAPSRDPRVALGKALNDRAAGISQEIAATWVRRRGPVSSAVDQQTHHDILRTTELATVSVAQFLVAGDFLTQEQSMVLAATGKAPVSFAIPLAELIKLYLNWRDRAMAAAREEAASLDTPEEFLAEAIAIIAAGADGSMVRMAKQLDLAYQEVQSQLEAEQARLVHLALHDGLTGLPNRAMFLGQLGRTLHEKGRPDRVAVLFVDLDHFKDVNDLAGHSAGDELLMAVADRLQEAVRPGDTVGRLGGDEFVVLCEDLRDGLAEAELVAERIGQALRTPVTVGGSEMVVTASIGVAVGGPGDDPELLLSHADGAMYMAKQRGRARFELYQQVPDER